MAGKITDQEIQEYLQRHTPMVRESIWDLFQGMVALSNKYPLIAERATREVTLKYLIQRSPKKHCPIFRVNFNRGDRVLCSEGWSEIGLDEGVLLALDRIPKAPNSENWGKDIVKLLDEALGLFFKK